MQLLHKESEIHKRCQRGINGANIPNCFNLNHTKTDTHLRLQYLNVKGCKFGFMLLFKCNSWVFSTCDKMPARFTNLPSLVFNEKNASEQMADTCSCLIKWESSCRPLI